MSIVKEVEFAGKKLKFEFNKFAKQANGSVMVSCGGTQVLVTVCAAAKAKEGQDFFPLTVDYIEKFYATGRIPGGFLKRETKPGDQEILTARVIDRPLRPSFPKGYLCETQVVCTVLSYDGVNVPATLATIGASTALMISDIPFNGPIGSIRLGMKDSNFIAEPEIDDTGDLDLVVSARPGAILMVEAGANFISEDKMIEALGFAQEQLEPIYAFQKDIQTEIGKAKREIETHAADAGLVDKVKEVGQNLIREALSVKEKLERKKLLAESSEKIKGEVLPSFEGMEADIDAQIDQLISKTMREQVIETGKRIDGRNTDEIRPLLCETGILDRAHGSSLFQRGETQALATITLGAGTDDEQRVDSILTPDQSKRFMLHYNFPPYSVGEARPLRAPGRREVGHGALAERALERVIPSAEDFGYTIRLVSEVLESNGSSSMATVCAGTMALLHAGAPIKDTVSGIAMGLIKEGERYAVLSDILGDEDHLGDMDFKVCGSEKGITALQMDIKIDGISLDILSEALQQAKAGREHIRSTMLSAIAEPSELSPYAPRVFQIRINQNKIRDLIGPGGKNIKRIVSETGVKVDINDEGMVSLISPTADAAEAAKSLIRSITADPEVGGIYLGTVKKVMDFGAVVEVKPGTEGLCHISQLENHRVQKVSEIVGEGDEIIVKIVDIDRQGKIKLSRKDALGKKPTFPR